MKTKKEKAMYGLLSDIYMSIPILWGDIVVDGKIAIIMEADTIEKIEAIVAKG